MNVRCPHCGAPNRVNALSGDQPGECVVCGRTLERASPEVSKRPRPIADESSVDLLNSGSSFDPVGWGDRGAEPISRAIRATVNPDVGGSIDGSIADSQVSLGDMPRGDEAIDIASILGQVDGLEETSSIDTDILSLKATPNQSLLPTVDAVSGTEWRVKSARGVIYEMSSTTEVLDWLNEHTDWDKIKVARALGPFLDVDSYPELERLEESAPHRIVTPSSVEQAPRFADLLVGSIDSSFDTGDEPSQVATLEAASGVPLELDYSRASERHSGQLERLGGAPIAQGAGIVKDSVGKSRNGRNELMTFRIPLMLVILTIAVVVGTTQAFQERVKSVEQMGTTSKKVEVNSDDNFAGEKVLRQAVDAIDAGNYTTAAQLLSRIESPTAHPEVFRYLAFALYKTNREQEAQQKLIEYRRRLRDTGSTK